MSTTYVSPTPTYELRHAAAGTNRFQVVESYRDQERVVYRSQTRRPAAAWLAELRELANRPPLTEAELDALCAAVNSTQGQW